MPQRIPRVGISQTRLREPPLTVGDTTYVLDRPLCRPRGVLVQCGRISVDLASTPPNAGCALSASPTDMGVDIT